MKMRDAVFASMTDTDVQTQSVIVGKAIRTDSADDNIGTKILDGHLTLLSKDKMSIEVYKNQIRALYPRCIVLVVSTPQQILANQMQRFETSEEHVIASLKTIAEQQQAELK
jgi:adenylate kinase